MPTSRPSDTRPPATSAAGIRGIRGRFERLFPGEQLVLVDRADAMGVVFDRLGHQRPATCGAYVLSYLFPALGLREHDGHDLTAEDYLAYLAAVTVEADEVPISDDVARRVSAGELAEAEAIERFGRVWYRYPVRSSPDPVETGTSPTGVARAVTVASSRRFAILPIAARLDDGSVQLTPERWNALLHRLEEHVTDWHWHAVFNYESDQLLRPRDPAYTPENLRADDVEARIHRDDWGVGHFVGLAGLWQMGGGGPWWLLLFDTYKERGFQGYQPQPAELMRRGLVREDGRGGGLLLVLPKEKIASAVATLRRLALTPRMWSNGSPEPEDWAWRLDDAGSQLSPSG